MEEIDDIFDVFDEGEATDTVNLYLSAAANDSGDHNSSK